MKKRKKQKQQNFPFLLLLAGGILLVLTSVLLWHNQRSQSAPEAPGSSGHEEETYPEIARVSLEDAKAAFDSGTAVFVDVRGDPAYAAAHIAGSVSLPLGELESRLDALDPSQWIIAYCT